MAILGIFEEFEATHGSRQVRRDNFTIELIIDGLIQNGFVSGIDYLTPKRRLGEVISTLAGQYLDDIVGRATNENIALYLMFNLRDLPIQSLKVMEGAKTYVKVSMDEFDVERYPAQLSYNLGNSFLLRENPEKAREFLTRAIALDNNFVEAYNLRGRCSKYLDDYRRALDDFLAAVRINPNLGEGWRNLGNAYLNLKRFDEMMPAFNRSVELMPRSALAINNRGYAYFVMENFELALKDHESAVQIDPCYAEAHHDKAMALRVLGRHEEAQASLDTSETLKRTAQDTYHGVKMY